MIENRIQALNPVTKKWVKIDTVLGKIVGHKSDKKPYKNVAIRVLKGMPWFSFRSKKKGVQGYCPAKDEAGVARFANYPIEGLVIKRVRWDGREFKEIKCQRN